MKAMYSYQYINKQGFFLGHQGIPDSLNNNVPIALFTKHHGSSSYSSKLSMSMFSPSHTA